MRKGIRIIAALTLAAVASLSLAAAAPAKARDRNHDRIPDRWEKRHKLSLKVKQARRDQDRDGLSNLGEYRAGLHPRDPDTDDDGLEDGDENAGRVVSLEEGVLTISLAGGGSVSATVGEGTHVKCRQHEDVVHKSSMPNPGSEVPVEWKTDEDPPSGDEPEEDEPAEEDEPSDEEKAEHEEEKAEHEECGLGDLVEGAKVSEAKLELHRGKLFWTKLELR